MGLQPSLLEGCVFQRRIYFRSMPTETIADRVGRVRSRIAAACRRSGRTADDVTLVAVTKGMAPELVREAFEAGIRHFGENRVQEAEAKLRALADVRGGSTWHMVGHLQSNKVKGAIALFDIIHSVDSLHLAETISQRAPVPVPVFLELNLAAESTKFGFSLHDLPGAYAAMAELPRLDVVGLMTVAPPAQRAEDVRPIFQRLREEARLLGLRGLSMGMSDDFEVAIEEGATHVRIGRAIFGERQR